MEHTLTIWLLKATLGFYWLVKVALLRRIPYDDGLIGNREHRISHSNHKLRKGHIILLKLTEKNILPYSTNFPGLGGILKTEPEDFVVEEIPTYLPSGEGEHLYLWIEKRNLDSRSMMKELSNALSVSRSEIGTAGMKDRLAVTTQYVSVPARCQGLIDAISTPELKVLDCKLHRNKLRTGHLKGNKFSIAIRDYDEGVFKEHFSDLFKNIQQQGFPNYYGEQRFGIKNKNVALGLELLCGKKKPRNLPGRDRKFLLKMSLSAVQSWLFNSVLAGRIDEGTVSQVLPGDVMQKTETGGCFIAEDIAIEQNRMESGETVITGPMFGCKSMTAVDQAAKIEEEVLSSANLSLEDFKRFPKITSGTRRPFVGFAEDLKFEVEPDVLWLRFSLKPGVYATSFLREMMKPESPDEDSGKDDSEN